MISRHAQIRQLTATLQPRLAAAPCHVQKIYSTSRFLSFQMRAPGKTFYLHVGRGGGHEGLWEGETPPPPNLRLRDTWLEWCRKNLSSTLWQSVEVDPCDRLVRLSFRRAGGRLDFYVFWAGRSSYFALHRHDGDEWFLSWRAGRPEHSGFRAFEEVGRKDVVLAEEVALATPLIAELWGRELAQMSKQRLPKAKLKSLQTKITRIGEDLAKIRQWPAFQEWWHLQDPETLGAEARFGSLRYKLPTGLGGWQKKEWLYGQLKRLKVAEAHQAKRHAQAEADLVRAHETPAEDENPLKPVRPIWGSAAPTTPATPVNEEGDYVIHTFEGYKIGVGSSARGNDQLRKLWAKPDDWWVHAAHGTSAHAVIKLAGVGVPTPAQITDAARLVAKQSGITSATLEVILTAVKNVRGVTGAAGMVTYKKNKSLLCDVSGKAEA